MKDSESRLPSTLAHSTDNATSDLETREGAFENALMLDDEDKSVVDHGQHETENKKEPTTSAAHLGSDFVRPEETPHHAIIAQYLLARVPEFQDLSQLRDKGWRSATAHSHFKQQRQRADHPNKKMQNIFFKMMDTIAHKLHDATDAFHPSSSQFASPCVLDFCMAPGGFLQAALALDPGTRARAYSLPEKDGGHKMLLSRSENVTTKFLDITMLNEDMGIPAAEIPEAHPDKENFLPREFPAPSDRAFDIVICDGMVLRQHARAPYREGREATRLLVTQLALGLEQIRPGGTMIILLHKPEILLTMQLLCTLSGFADVQLFKQEPEHATRSSFYAVVKDVRPLAPGPLTAVKGWKEAYRVATFGTKEEYEAMREVDGSGVEDLLEEFGPTFIDMASPIWGIQAKALSKARWACD